MTPDLSEFYNTLPNHIKQKFETLAYLAINLGYKIKRDKVKHVAFSFVSSKYKNGIMRFVYDKNQYQLKLKYFGIITKSKELEICLKETIEEFNFKYTGCYKCGKCKDKKEGYIIKYDNGNSFFRCGSEYIDINNFENTNIDEIQNAIIEQTKYYEEIYKNHRTTAST